MTRRPASLAHTILRRSLGAIIVFGIVAVSYASIPVVDFSQDDHAGTMSIRDNAPGSPADLIDRHDCWTGEAPADMAGKIPGHVVVSVGATPSYEGVNMVGRALEQTFDGVDHGLRVHAFCR